MKGLVNKDRTSCLITKDFGFDCVGHEEPSNIFKSGGDRIGLIFGKPISEAW